MEVKRHKEEVKIERQLAVNREDTATEVQIVIPARDFQLVFSVKQHQPLFECLSSYREEPGCYLMCVCSSPAGDGLSGAGGRPARG